MSAVADRHIDGDAPIARSVYERAAYDARMAAERARARIAEIELRVAALSRAADVMSPPDSRRAAECAWTARHRARAALMRLADAHGRAAAVCDAQGAARAATRHRIAAATASEQFDRPFRLAASRRSVTV